MEFKKIFRRFLIPPFVVTVFSYFKFGCKISLRAEVELSSFLQIGKKTTVSSFTKINASRGPLIIGNNVSIAKGCHIGSGKKGVYIGNDCLISPHVLILGGNHRYDRLDIPIKNQGHVSKGIRINDNVWIGAGACIMDGSEIGSGAIITPNSVISASIPEYTIVQGNPGKVIFTRRP